MIMLLRILGRLVKSGTRVLLVGWTPKPPPDLEARLHAVEQLAWKLDKRAQRAANANEEQGVAVTDDGNRDAAFKAMFPQGYYNGAPVNLPRG